MQMKKIARRQSEDAQGGEKSKKSVKSSMKPRKSDDSAGKTVRMQSFVTSSQFLSAQKSEKLREFLTFILRLKSRLLLSVSTFTRETIGHAVQFVCINLSFVIAIPVLRKNDLNAA